MHMLGRKDPNSAEVYIVQVFRNPFTVFTANGEVQTDEEKEVYVNVLDLFMTEQILEATPAFTLFGKLCGDHGYADEWTSGQTAHFSKRQENYNATLENYVPIQSEMVLRHVQQVHEVGVNPGTGRPVARFQRNQKQKMRASIEHGGARCVIYRNCWRNSMIVCGRSF